MKTPYRALPLSLLMFAGMTGQGCELRPSRGFVPTTTVMAGPAPRAFTPSDDASDLDAAPPLGSTVSLDDGSREQVVVRRLENGMMLHALPRFDVPGATILVVLGTKTSPAPLSTAMIYMGAALRGRPMPWSRIELDGARSFTVGRVDFVSLGITGLAHVIEPALGRLLPAIIAGSLWDIDVAAAKESLIEGLGSNEADRRAYKATFVSLFPPPHPYASAADTKIAEAIRDVKVKEVRAFRDANLRADNMMITAAGNVNVDSLVATLDRALATLPRAPVAVVPVAPAVSACAGNVLTLADAGSQQTTMSVAFPAVPATHPDAPALEVLASAAGGSLATHLNVLLRNERGLTYGFQATMEGMREGGLFRVQGDVDPARTVEAMTTLNAELEALRRTTLDDDSLRAAKIGAIHRSSRLGGAATAVRLAHAATQGIPLADSSAIRAVTAEQVRAVAERHLDPAKRCVVVVGDAARLERDLRGAALGPLLRAQP